MQKKILSAVLALCLVGSTSVAFAGYYDIDVTKTLDIHDSFKDQSDDDYVDVDVKKSFNDNDNDGYDIDIKNSGNKDYTTNISSDTKVKVNAQGNLVAGKFVVQQFGTGGGAGGGDVVNIDNSINGSKINSYNNTDSYNTNISYTSNKNKTYNVSDSYNTSKSYSSSTDAWIGVDLDYSKNFSADHSFNGNRLGAPMYKRAP